MSKSNYTINPKKLKELCTIKELQNENLSNNEDIRQKLLLRKTQRPDYTDPLSTGMKEKVLIGLNNGRWNNDEHRAFIEGIFKYSNDWKKIIEDVKTRSCLQARSHSQKFFAKLGKYISKSNANYYVDLKKIYCYGSQIKQESKDSIIEMLVFAHDHLDNVFNCQMLNHYILSDFLEIARKNKMPNFRRNMKITNESDSDWKLKKSKAKNQSKDEVEDESEESVDDSHKDHDNNHYHDNLNKYNKKQIVDGSEKYIKSKMQSLLGSNVCNLNEAKKIKSENVNFLKGENSLKDRFNMHNYLNSNSKKVGSYNYKNNNNYYFKNNIFVNLSIENNNKKNACETNNCYSNYNSNINDNQSNLYNPSFIQTNFIYAISNRNETNNNNNETFQVQESHPNKIANNVFNNNEHERSKNLNGSKSKELILNINQNFNKCFKSFEDNNNNTNEANKFSYFELKKNSLEYKMNRDEYYNSNTRSGSFNKNSTKTDLQSLQQCTNSNSNGNFYENESQININNLNLTTLKDSTEEAKSKNDRWCVSKKTEKTSIRESSMNQDFVVPQPIKNNISNLIQINSEFGKTFSQEIEKDNFFKKHSFEVKNNTSPLMDKSYSNSFFNSEIKTNKDDNFNSYHNINNNNNYNYNNNLSEINENYNYDDNPMGKISAYDYNNFYFNRCLEYLKKNSNTGKTNLIQEIKKCFIFPKKLLIESNYCNCCKCIAENSDKAIEYTYESYPESDKKCINNQYYYCEFDDISFISNHEKHCYMNYRKKNLYSDSYNSQTNQ